MSKSRKKTAGNSDTTIAELEPTQAAAPDTNAAANVDRQRVASRAYELYIQRGRQQGRALDDWLEAEQELLQSTRRNRDRE